MTNGLEPVGFWSYARLDDESSGGRLSRLRTLLRMEIQQQFGREGVTLYQDVAAIPPGAAWEADIREALSRSSYFIPIITPSFVESPWCMKEIEIFFEHVATLEARFPDRAPVSRIFPLFYIDIEGCIPADAAAWARLETLQRLDFRDQRRMNVRSLAVQSKLGDLAASVCATLRKDREYARQASAAPPASPAPQPVRDQPRDSAPAAEVESLPLPPPATAPDGAGSFFEAAPAPARADAAGGEAQASPPPAVEPPPLAPGATAAAPIPPQPQPKPPGLVSRMARAWLSWPLLVRIISVIVAIPVILYVAMFVAAFFAVILGLAH